MDTQDHSFTESGALAVHVTPCWWCDEQAAGSHGRLAVQGLEEAGRVLGAWQQALAAVSGLLSKKTFLDRPSQSGRRATQPGSTWQSGNDRAGAWVLDLSAGPAALLKASE